MTKSGILKSLYRNIVFDALLSSNYYLEPCVTYLLLLTMLSNAKTVLLALSVIFASVAYADIPDGYEPVKETACESAKTLGSAPKLVPRVLYNPFLSRTPSDLGKYQWFNCTNVPTNEVRPLSPFSVISMAFLVFLVTAFWFLYFSWAFCRYASQLGTR